MRWDASGSVAVLRTGLISYVPPDSETQRPTALATTLITVNRADVEKINQLLAATAAMLPRTTRASTVPHGDLRAHIEKAQEIARELLPPSPAAQPVGTSGGKQSLVTIDRTALQRLATELDAAERVAPRHLTSTSRRR
jgi:hypothetical protein